MTGNFSGELSSVLYVDPATVEDQQRTFLMNLEKLGRAGKGKRTLFEEVVPVIGANGVLLGLETLWPLCHDEAHDLGKVIYAAVRDVGTALRVCRDGCHSGCMHGVLMEAFASARASGSVDPERHVDIDLVHTMMGTICADTTMVSSYSPGDCAHGVGHAMMVLADYEVPDAIRYCDEFSKEHMRYYCATGAYMEYVTERDAADAAAGKSLLYPCDTGKYPAACARYKMVHVVGRLVKKTSDVRTLVHRCDQLAGKYRLGCYHGAGNGLISALVTGKVTLQDVCGQGTVDERSVCIDGAMERMQKYHPDQARAVCDALPPASLERKTCEDARARGMYDMKKDLRLYAQ